MSKGSNRRPKFISDEEYARNFELAFSSKVGYTMDRTLKEETKLDQTPDKQADTELECPFCHDNFDACGCPIF